MNDYYSVKETYEDGSYSLEVCGTDRELALQMLEKRRIGLKSNLKGWKEIKGIYHYDYEKDDKRITLSLIIDTDKELDEILAKIQGLNETSEIKE